MPSYIVGLDGSTLAEATLPYATTMARVTGASLVLVQAVPEEEEAGPDGPTPTSPDDIVRFQWGPSNAALLAADEYLSGLAQRLRESGLAAHVVVKIGDAADILIEEAQGQGADLLFLGSHGRTGVSRLLYGSVAEAVLRRTPIPLLLVPARSIDHVHGGLPRTLVVPLDGSLLAEAALPEALDLAQMLHAELRLLRVIAPTSTILLAENAVLPSLSSPDIVETEEEAAEKYLHQIAERVRPHGVAVSYSVSFDQAGAAIRRVADGIPGSMIVMATHARGGVSRVLLGSIAVDIVRHGTAPVVLVRPSGVILDDPAGAPVATNAGNH